MSFGTRYALRHSPLAIAHHRGTALLTSGTAIFFRFINTSTKFSRACEEIPSLKPVRGLSFARARPPSCCTLTRCPPRRRRYVRGCSQRPFGAAGGKRRASRGEVASVFRTAVVGLVWRAVRVEPRRSEHTHTPPPPR